MENRIRYLPPKPKKTQKNRALAAQIAAANAGASTVSGQHYQPIQTLGRMLNR